MDIREQVLMERIKVSVADILGPEIAASLSLDRADKMLEETLIAKLTAKVLAREVIRDTRTYYVDHPATWWQHLKHTVAPKWYKRRWPVKFDRTEIAVHFKQYETYPRASTLLPPSQFGYPVVIETVKHEIDSKFPVLHDGGLTPKNDCLTKPELVNYILRYAASADYTWPLGPTDAYNMLEALESLGVHVAGLVSKDAVR